MREYLPISTLASIYTYFRFIASGTHHANKMIGCTGNRKSAKSDKSVVIRDLRRTRQMRRAFRREGNHNPENPDSDSLLPTAESQL